MTCIHGLDENSCPTCRLVKASMPINHLSTENLRSKLKPENPAFKRDLKEKEEFLKDIGSKPMYVNKTPVSIIPNPKMLNKPPNFENKMFLERLKEIDVSKSDTFNISKKVTLERPEWKLDEE